MATWIPQNLRHEIRRQQRLWQLRHLTGKRGAAVSPQDPVTVYGLFSAASGLGQAVRLLADNLEQIGYTVHRIDTAPHLFGIPHSADRFDQDPGEGPIIIHLNPVEAAEVMVALDPPGLSQRPRIGLWLYELDRAPAYWRPYVGLFDRIWSPSTASAAAMRAIGATALTVPYCHSDMSRTSSPLSDPAQNAVFTVVAMADARSSLARKNVSGVLAAFQAAFGGTDGPVRLLLKISNLPDDAPLRMDVAEMGSVDLAEDRLSFSDVMALLRQADVFLSLHRSEGYGLTLVEAMQMGVPVIMTDEHSTRSLQLSQCSWLVPSRPIPVNDPQQIYASGLWADPDIEVAATHLRTLWMQWENGQLAKGHGLRVEAAARRFSSPDRLMPLREAMACLPMKKAPQTVLRGLDIQGVGAA